MLDVQGILDAACGHDTVVAAAMVAACLAWSARTGVPLSVPARAKAPAARAVRHAGHGVDWERMVRSNSDTRWTHV